MIQAEGNITSSIIFCVRAAKEKKEKCKNLKSEGCMFLGWWPYQFCPGVTVHKSRNKGPNNTQQLTIDS